MATQEQDFKESLRVCRKIRAIMDKSHSQEVLQNHPQYRMLKNAERLFTDYLNNMR